MLRDPLPIGSSSQPRVRPGQGRRFPRIISLSIYLLTRILLCAAVLFAGPVALAQNPATPPSRKFSHTPPALPLTDFYATPDPLPAGKPGELIRSEPFYEYRLFYDISAVRILYHSRSPGGQDVAVSGVVLLPRKPLPQVAGPLSPGRMNSPAPLACVHPH